jgi:hypothetical protein
MAVIKSGATTDQLTVDPTSKAARVTLYDSAGAEKTASAPLPVIQGTGRGTLVGNYTVTSFRTLGLATQPHNVFSIWNPVASGKNLAIRRITIQLDHTTLLATNLHFVSSHPAGQPSGGTALTPTKFDDTYAAAVATPLGATASDGGAATAITATPGTRVWTQFGQRAHTLVGWFTTDDLFMIPEQCCDNPIIIAPGDGLMVYAVSVATVGAHYVINCWWEEYTP